MTDTSETFSFDELVAAGRDELDTVTWSRAGSEARVAAVAEAARVRETRRRRAHLLALAAMCLLGLAPLVEAYLTIHGPQTYPYPLHEFPPDVRAELDMGVWVRHLRVSKTLLLVGFPLLGGTFLATRGRGMARVIGRGMQWVVAGCLLGFVSVFAWDYAFDDGLSYYRVWAQVGLWVSAGLAGAAAFGALGQSRELAGESEDRLEDQIPYARLFRTSMTLAVGDILVLLTASASLFPTGLRLSVGTQEAVTLVAIAAIMSLGVWGLQRLKTWALMLTIAANFAVFVGGFWGLLSVGPFIAFLGFTTAIQLILPVPLVTAIVRGEPTSNPRLERLGRRIADWLPAALATYCAVVFPLSVLVAIARLGLP